MAVSVTAALLVIGDEILTGRTKDKNIGYIAEYLTGIGIDLREVRVVPDVEEEIVAAVNALRGRYTYLFTTGGIGPTHDDITADCIAKAFGVGIDHDPRARRDAAGALQAGGAQRGPPAHGPDPRRRRPDREPDLQGAGLPHRQRLRHGGRALDHAGHARQHRADPGDRRAHDHRDHRGGGPGRGHLCRGPGPDRLVASRASPSAPIRRSPPAASATRSSCAARTRRRLPRPPLPFAIISRA